MFRPFITSILLVSMPLLADQGPTTSPANTWVAAKPVFELPTHLKDARWETGDGFSDSVYRSKTGGILIRSIHAPSAGLAPGFYTNTTVEWDLKSGRAIVIETSSWGGGSYGKGSLPADFANHPTPSPRHTYDGICYVRTCEAPTYLIAALR